MNIQEITIPPLDKLLFINLNVSSYKLHPCFLLLSWKLSRVVLIVLGSSVTASLPTGFPALKGHVPIESATSPGLGSSRGVVGSWLRAVWGLRSCMAWLFSVT